MKPFLLENNRQIEERRRQFDSVLSSVTAGVVGLDETGRVDFVNRSAERLLELPEEAGQSTNIAYAVPEFGPHDLVPTRNPRLWSPAPKVRE